MPDREKIIEGLEWILKGDRFGFGKNWDAGEPKDDEEKAGKIIWDTLKLLKQQKHNIRCAECKHWNKESGLSARMCSEWNKYTTQREFCSRAVKQDD